MERPDFCNGGPLIAGLEEFGVCEAYISKFTYNSATGKCEAYIYGGCGGTRNLFNTRETCERVCKPGKSDIKYNNQNPCDADSVVGWLFATP